jgi:hypothetical protein
LQQDYIISWLPYTKFVEIKDCGGIIVSYIYFLSGIDKCGKDIQWPKGGEQEREEELPLGRFPRENKQAIPGIGQE